MKAYLQSKVKIIRIAKVVVASLLGVMVVIDIVLVALEKKGFPSFSWVVRDHRTQLIWLTFLFGGLVAKVFYNRRVNLKESEASGFLTFFVMIALLFILGHLIETKISTLNELIILLSGGLLAYRVWPQYYQDTKPKN